MATLTAATTRPASSEPGCRCSPVRTASPARTSSPYARTASVKIVAIVGFLVGGLVVIFFGVGPAGGTATFANLFSVDAPGTAGGSPPFGVVGLLFAIQIAVFSYQGAELVGMTAVETRDRERTIPKAINSVPLRIILFYVGSLAVLMSVIPWTSFNSDDSPFVQALAQIGVRQTEQQDHPRGASRSLEGLRRSNLTHRLALPPSMSWR